jgi:hypothetical protein
MLFLALLILPLAVTQGQETLENVHISYMNRFSKMATARYTSLEAHFLKSAQDIFLD